MKGTVTSKQVKDFILQQGMDLVGITSVKNVPVSTPPRPITAVMPTAKSVVVIGMRQLIGSTQSPNQRVIFAGLGAVSSQLDRATLYLGRFLEDQGYLAAIFTTGMTSEMNQESRGMVGDISLKHCAIAAGLGVTGVNKLVLTPKWGPRVRLTAVVTDAPLEADKPIEADYCAGCNICIQNCPAGAISEKGLDAMKCIRESLKYGMGPMIRFVSGLMGKPVEEAQKQIRDPFFWNMYQAVGVRNMYTCFNCINLCPAGEHKLNIQS